MKETLYDVKIDSGGKVGCELQGHTVDTGFPFGIGIDLIADKNGAVLIGIDANGIILDDRTDIGNDGKGKAVAEKYLAGFTFNRKTAVIGKDIAAEFPQMQGIGMGKDSFCRTAGS